MTPPNPYRGARVVLATRHGKQRVIGRALRHGLGAELVHLADLDTDQLGSFCGAVPRSMTALQACIAKAELALAHADSDLAIASEGSFGPHPALPLLAVGVEVMVFLDRQRGLTIHDHLQARRTNFASRRLTAEAISAGSFSAELERWLVAVGFPSHGLIVRRDGSQAGVGALHKGIHRPEELLAVIRKLLTEEPAGLVRLETDMRAHCNPTRMASIRQLSFRLVRRLRSQCAGCGSPGWGAIGSEAGLPCGWCGEPTALVRSEIHGCVVCDQRLELPRRDGRRSADPGHCLHCNP